MSAGRPSISARKKTLSDGAGEQSSIQSDKRLLWLEQRIVSSLHCRTNDFRKWLEDDDARRDIIAFLETDSCRALFSYLIADASSAVRTSLQPSADMLSSSKLLCIRKVGKEKISPENIGKSLQVTELPTRIAEGAHLMSSQVSWPIMSSDERLTSMPTAINSSVHRHMKTLLSDALIHAGKEGGRTLLALPTFPLRGDVTRHHHSATVVVEPSEESHQRIVAQRNESDSTHNLELLATQWAEQLRGVALCDSRSRYGCRFAEDGSIVEVVCGVNPLEECAYWNSQLRDMEGVTAQLARAPYTTVTEELRKRNSDYATVLMELAYRLRDTLNEVRSITRWLTPLQQHFESIDPDSRNRIDFPELIRHNVFPILFHLLHLLWQKNHVYGTAERLGSLMKGVCDRVVEYAVPYLSLENYFLSDVTETLQRLNVVFDVTAKLKSAIFRFKEQSADTAKPWTLHHQIILHRVDMLLERCHDLKDLIELRQLFEWAGGMDVGGVDGIKLRETIEEINTVFNSRLTQFSREAFDSLASPDQQFDLLAASIKQTALSMQQRIAHVMTEHVRTSCVTEQLVRRIITLEHFVNRPQLSNFWFDIMATLWQRWLAELRSVQIAFSETPDSRTFNPLLPVATQEISYGVGTLLRLTALHDAALPLLRRWRMDPSDDLFQALELYRVATRRVATYIEQRFEVWKISLTSTLQLLDQRLLTADVDGQVFVQYDNALVTATKDVELIASSISQVKSIDGSDDDNAAITPLMKLQMPNEIISRLLVAHDARRSRCLRLHVAVSLFNERQMELRPYEQSLFLEEQRYVEKKLAAGLDTLTWNCSDAELDAFCICCEDAVERFGKAIDTVRSAVQQVKAVFANLSAPEMTVLPLIVSRIGDKTLQLEELIAKAQMLHQRRSKVAEEAEAVLSTIANSTLSRLNEAKSVCGVVTVPPNGEDWVTFLKDLDKCVLGILEEHATKSLTSLLQQIDPKWLSANDGLPLVDARLSVSRDTNSILIQPPFEEGIIAAVHGLADDAVHSFEGLRCVEGQGKYVTQLVASPSFVAVKGSLEKLISSSRSQVERLFAAIQPLSALWDSQLEKKIHAQLGVGMPPSDAARFFTLTCDELEDEVRRRDQFGRDIGEVASTWLVEGWLRIDCRVAKATLRTNAINCRKIFLDHIAQRIQATMKEAQDFMNLVRTSITDDLLARDDSTSLRHLFELLRNVQQRDSRVRMYFQPMADGLKLLSKFGGLPKEEVEMTSETLVHLESSWDKTVKRSLTVREQLTALQNRECDRIREEIATFQEEVHSLVQKFQDTAIFLGAATPSDVFAVLDDWKGKWTSIAAKVADFNYLQTLYDVTKTQFQDVSDALEHLQQAKDVWDLVDLIEWEFKDWLNMPFMSTDTAQLADETRHIAAMLSAKPNAVKEWKCFKSAETKVRRLLASLPVIQDLRSPAMRMRHWEELLALCHMERDTIEDPASALFTVDKLMQLNLHNYTAEVGRLVEKADKELAIERTLERISGYWLTAKVQTEFRADLGVLLLSTVDEAVEHLEEHVSWLQPIMVSRWVEFFRQQVAIWQQRLGIVEATIALWMEVQKQWTNLRPIFRLSADMRQHLPKDAAAFDQIDEAYLNLMRKVTPTTRILSACTERDISADVTLQSALEAIQDVLNACEKALSEYLEAKRRIFPRFYFLSDADLVDILSKANEPPLVLRHVAKLVSAIETCVFADEQTNAVTQVVSTEGEVHVLTQPCICEGRVECWLQQFVDRVQEGVRGAIIDANTAYVETPRLEWMFHHIAQAVSVVARAHWTMETSLALEAAEDGNVAALADHARHLKLQLARTIETVLHDLSVCERKTLITLVTIDTHCRDIVLELIAKHIDTANAFAWQSQLRFYLSDANVHCQICDADLMHCLEYIGNCGCLVVTPLTDRCYITLTQAIKLHKGGAPAGPAGTGKTETVKDLAHALGRAVYVFNCSDQMDYLSVGSIFKGLSMSGAWGCFDEFNRISIEVLSVVASQVKSVLDGLRRKASHFTLLQQELPLHSAVGIFITMNPGYKGRTELPENIKALFRPCAMVVPDVQYICEIMLSAEGFVSAKDLAKKFVRLYQLNKDLLSPAAHYDWGLRALRSVLFIAGSLKRREPGLDERATLMRALRDSNLAKLMKGDVAVFLRLIAALFPGVAVDSAHYRELEDCVRSVAKSRGAFLGEAECVLTKCVQLHELLLVRHSVFVLGPAGCGKSTILRLLANGLHESTSAATVMEVMDPKALSSNELYGWIQESTREWKDGILARTFREFATNPRFKKSRQWLVLDGMIDADWIESMNSVMDDNKLLTLASNERIVMTPQMRLLFEITHLHHATPATVSRAGILFINDTDIGWGPMKDGWVSSRALDQERSHLDILFDKHVSNFMQFLQVSSRSMLPMTASSYVRSLCSLLNAVLTSDAFKGIPSDLYERIFLWCCIWTFGSTIIFPQGVVDYRQMFSTYVKREFAMALRIPEHGTVFDYALCPSEDKRELEWVPWEDKLPQKWEMQPGGAAVPECIVPTPDTVRYGFFLQLLAQCGTPALLVGGAGCGKSVIVQSLSKKLCGMEFETSPFSTKRFFFTALTDSNSFQVTLERQLEKRTGKQYGPANRKKLICILENLNMPSPDKYGSQSALALLRQQVDHGFWYSRAKLTPMEIVDLQYIATMDPHAGSKHVEDRIAYKFVALGVGTPPREVLVKVFSDVLRGIYRQQSVRDEIRDLSEVAVGAIVDAWVNTVKTFPPSATCFHYIFTLRDLARCIEGMANITAHSQVSLVPRLVQHELQRVLCDRLSSAEGRSSVHRRNYVAVPCSDVGGTRGRCPHAGRYVLPPQPKQLRKRQRDRRG